jgi:hypothetical protein
MNIEQQLQKIDNELNKHLHRFKRIIGQRLQVRCVDVSIILKAFVRRGQHKLNVEFECKKRLLYFDLEDHRLTKAFFDLKPTSQQVQLIFRIYYHHHVVLICCIDSSG